MMERTDNPDTDEARGALKSVAAMRRAGVERAAPPRWFTALVALVVGGHVAVQGLFDLSLYATAVPSALALMTIYFVHQTRRASARRPSTAIGVYAVMIAFICAALGVVVLAVVAFYLRVRVGAGFAAWPIGGAAAVLTFGAFEAVQALTLWSANRSAR